MSEHKIDTPALEDTNGCIMVTGGVGFVGSHVAETLLREGKRVVVYDIFNSETTISAEKKENAQVLRDVAEEFAANGASVDIVHGDVRDKENILATISEYGVTGCVHLGGMVDDRRSVLYPEEYVSVNVLGTCTLLDALGQSGVKNVVQASTRSVYGERADNDTLLTEDADRRPVNPYGASKIGADAMAHCYSHLYKMNVSLIRIFSAYGPRGRPDMIPRILIENIVNDQPIRKFGDGNATRTWTYISDIVSGFMCALKNPPSTLGQGFYAEYNTGAPNSKTLNELIATAEKVVGKKAIIEQYPVPAGDAHTVGHPCCNKLQEALGWKPKVDVEEGFRLTYLDYMRQRKMQANKSIRNNEAKEEEKKEDDVSNVSSSGRRRFYV